MKITEYFVVLFQLFIALAKKKLKLILSAILLFFTKWLSMLVMFLPLKILFSLSMDPASGPAAFIESYFWPGSYITVMFSGMMLLSLLNVLVRIVQERLQKQAKIELQSISVHSPKGVIDGKVMSSLSSWYSAILCDCFMVVFGIVVICMMNLHIAMGFILLIFMQVWILDRIMFNSTQSKLEYALKINRAKINEIVFNLFFLLIFMIISITYLLNPFDVVYAVLILLISRLGLQSVKSFFTASVKFRKKLQYA